MNKRIIPLLILAFLILTTIPIFVSGALLDNIITYYSFEGGSVVDNMSHHNATNSGASVEVGLVGDAMYCNSTEDDYISTWNYGVPADSFGNISGAFSINFLFKMKVNTSASQNFIGMYDAGSRGILLNNFAGGTDKIAVEIYADAYGFVVQSTASSVYRDTNWHMLTFAKPSNTVGDWRLYLDGVLLATTSGGTGGTDYTDWNGQPYLCSRYNSKANDGNMSIDEVGFWDRNLTQEDITNLYNNYTAGIGYPFNVTGGGGATQPVVSFIPPTPTNNSHNNTQVNISLNCSSTGTKTYYLWFDNSSGVTPVLVNSSVSYWVTNVTIDDQYFYKGACYNGTLSDNSTGYSWFFDSTNPVIVLNGSNEFNAGNFSVKDQFDNWLNLSINLSDNIGLYAFKINVTTGFNESGSCMFNYTNLTLGNTSQTSWSYVYDVNVTGWGSGLYYVKLMVADTHTSNFIDDYDVIVSDDALVFDTAEGNKILISAVDSVSSSYSKVVDSYEFGFDYPVLKDGEVVDRVFVVESLFGGKVSYLKDSGYKAHFVIWAGGFGGNWVDFEGVDGIPEVFCESDYRCVVTFKDVVSDSLVFKSIGGLNVVSAYYSWYRGVYSLVDSGVFTGEPVNLTLNISNHSSMSFVNVSVVHNGISYNDSFLGRVDYGGYSVYSLVVGSPLVSGVIPYYWYLVDLQNDSNVTILNISDNYTAYYWNIDVCNVSGYNVSSVLFNISFENIPNLNLSGDLELDIQVWVNNYSAYKQVNLNYSDNWSFGVCMINDTDLRINLYSKVRVDSGDEVFTHRYYLFNQSINGSSPLNILLYNFNYSGDASLLRITSRDVDTYQYYPDVIGRFERWYVGEGVWRVVQMDRSDDYGLLIYDVVEKSVDYRIKFYDTSNVLLKTSDILRFSCTSGLCELTALISAEGEGVSGSNLSVWYSYNNVTGIVNVSWLDNSVVVDSVRILVSRSTMSGSFYLFNVTQNGSSGSYLINISNQTGSILFSVMSTSSPEVNSFSFWVTRVLNTFEGLFSDTGEGAWWGFLIMVVVVFIGLVSPVATIVASIVGLIVIFSLGLFSGLTFTLLMVAVVMGVVLGIKVRK